MSVQTPGDPTKKPIARSHEEAVEGTLDALRQIMDTPATGKIVIHMHQGTPGLITIHDLVLCSGGQMQMTLTPTIAFRGPRLTQPGKEK